MIGLLMILQWLVRHSKQANKGALRSVFRRLKPQKDKYIDRIYLVA